MNKKVFLPILILSIVGVLMVAGVAYYFSKKSAPDIAKGYDSICAPLGDRECSNRIGCTFSYKQGQKIGLSVGMETYNVVFDKCISANLTMEEITKQENERDVCEKGGGIWSLTNSTYVYHCQCPSAHVDKIFDLKQLRCVNL